MNILRVKQIRSLIGVSKTQRLTIKGLGLGKINKEVKKHDTVTIRGMISKVQHLLSVVVERG